MADDETPRSLHQIISASGEAYEAVGTENVWIGYGPGQQFGVPTGNNDVMPLTSGKRYFEEFVKEVTAATDEIYIAGWQVNWDALMAPGQRLFDVLLEAAKRGIKIYVMPWDDTPPVQTYDDQTKAVLEMINTIVGKPLVQVRLATAHADRDASFFSHHQKQVVIDRKTAFIGGLDLAYGRYDDATFDLHANAENRYALNRYNGCIHWSGVLDTKQVVDPDASKGFVDSYAKNPLSENSKTNAELTQEAILAGAWQTPYEPQGGDAVGGSFVSSRAEPNKPMDATLAAKSQPRMPWQDVHCKIVGPAVIDLTRNFVLRWNSTKPVTRLDLPELLVCPIENKCLVQVLRSAPLAMRQREYKSLAAKDFKKTVAPTSKQDDILRAMVSTIGKAQHFIYIENQFFVSAFGRLAGYEGAAPNVDPRIGPSAKVMSDGGGFGRTMTRAMPGTSTTLPHNGIVDALAKRIDLAIRNAKPTPFHVYIALPVHSEGLLNDAAIMAQVHWTMQSLVFGTQSLLNRIRRSLCARQLYDKKDNNWRAAYQEGHQGYQDIDIEQCFDYVTLLNLRNWAKLGSGKDERYVTEQIYIHSKLLIVDDRYAILGSANINDRSLDGGRDSELAVLVVDTDSKTRDLRQNGKQVPVRHFARELRKQIWRKIFGITAGGDKAANELKAAVLQPAAPASWKAIQKRAGQNRDLYEAAFDWIPRNWDIYDRDKKLPAPIWPRWETELEKKRINEKLTYAELNPMPQPMPFDAAFWKEAQHSPAAAQLTEVKGFITLLPIRWTEGENNKIPFHNALVTQRDKSPLESEGDTRMAASNLPAKAEGLV